MKKIISSVLAAATLFSLTGCNKKSSSTTSKTLASEPSSSASESSQETESTTTTAAPTPTGPSAFAKENSTEAIPYTIKKDQQVYAALGKTDEEKITRKVFYDFDDIEITDGKYARLQTAIDEELKAILEPATECYAQALAEFKKHEAAGEALHSTYLQGKLRVFRADEQIFSFTYDLILSSYAAPITYVFNFDARTGERFYLKDFITDRSAFFEYATNMTKQAGLGKEFVEANAGEEIDMLLVATYDGLAFPTLQKTQSYVEDSSDNGVWFRFTNIPVAGETDIFNLKYFENLPSTYLLTLGCDDKLLWDFTGDGVLDTLAVDVTTRLKSAGDSEDPIEMDKITIKLNDNTREISLTDDVSDAVDIFRSAYVVKHNDRWFLHIQTDSSASLGSSTYVYSIGTDVIQDAGAFSGWLDYSGNMTPITPTSIDPDDIKLYSIDFLTGTYFCLYQECTLGADGLPVPKASSTVFKGFAPDLTTAIDITGMKLDPSGKALAEVTIEKDSSLALVECSGFHDAELYMIVEVLHEDPAENYRIKLPCTFVNYETFVNGKPIHEVFYHILRGD
ncbi:MAG: hypothetical protein J5752_02540 [Clostridiales bacterium]|nr:hypothetical protein [Clostridiales bacterium]